MDPLSDSEIHPDLKQTALMDSGIEFSPSSSSSISSSSSLSFSGSLDPLIIVNPALYETNGSQCCHETPEDEISNRAPDDKRNVPHRWHIVGEGSPLKRGESKKKPHCGKWIMGASNDRVEGLDLPKLIGTRPYKCTRRECPSCFDEGFLEKSVGASVEIIQKNVKILTRSGRSTIRLNDQWAQLRVFICIISLKENDRAWTEKALNKKRNQAYKIAKKHGLISGLCYVHPFRGGGRWDKGQEKRDKLDRSKMSLHFHVIGLGYYTEPVKKSCPKCKGIFYDTLKKNDPDYQVITDCPDCDLPLKAPEYIFISNDLGKVTNNIKELDILWSVVHEQVRYHLDHAGYIGNAQITTRFGWINEILNCYDPENVEIQKQILKLKSKIEISDPESRKYKKFVSELQKLEARLIDLNNPEITGPDDHVFDIHVKIDSLRLDVRPKPIVSYVDPETGYNFESRISLSNEECIIAHEMLNNMDLNGISPSHGGFDEDLRFQWYKLSLLEKEINGHNGKAWDHSISAWMELIKHFGDIPEDKILIYKNDTFNGSKIAGIFDLDQGALHLYDDDAYVFDDWFETLIYSHLNTLLHLDPVENLDINPLDFIEHIFHHENTVGDLSSIPDTYFTIFFSVHLVKKWLKKFPEVENDDGSI